MTRHLPTIILASLLAIVLAAGAFVACHAHGSGYYTLTIALGDSEPPISLAEVMAMPNKQHLAFTATNDGIPQPLPKHKPIP